MVSPLCFQKALSFCNYFLHVCSKELLSFAYFQLLTDNVSYSLGNAGKKNCVSLFISFTSQLCVSSFGTQILHYIFCHLQSPFAMVSHLKFISPLCKASLLIILPSHPVVSLQFHVSHVSPVRYHLLEGFPRNTYLLISWVSYEIPKPMATTFLLPLISFLSYSKFQ